MNFLTKHFTVAILLTILSGTLFSQELSVRAGLNLSNMVIKDDQETYSDDFNMNTGFHLGAAVNFPFSDVFSIETGLLLSTKGYKIKGEDFTSKWNLMYLDIPLNAKASFELGDIKMYGLLGPYIGLGISGKNSNKSEGEKNSETINWGSDENASFKRLDFGLTVGAGVEISSLQIGLQYGLGLANIAPSTDGGNQINNRLLTLALGYKIGSR